MPGDHARQEAVNTGTDNPGTDNPETDNPGTDNPGADNPAPMTQSSEAGSSRLESVPNELLMKIVEEVGNEERRRGWNAESPVRSGYHSLCLVSKRIDLIARPYLFKNIPIKDFRSLVRLCRAIAGDQILGHEITQIYLSIDFHQMTKRGPLPLTLDEEAKVLDDCYQIIGKCGSETSQRVEKDSDLIGMLCYELVSRAVNLRSLTVYMGGSGCLDDAIHRRDQGHSTFFDLVRGAVLSAADGAGTVFLPRLENLTLWRCDGNFECELFGLFLGLPGLRTIKGVADDGNWRQLRNSSVGSTVAPLVCRNIERLQLSISGACQDDIEDIVQFFPSLQVLSIHGRDPQSTRMRSSVAAGVARGLSIALENMTALRELHIDIFAYAPFEHHFYDYVTTSLGPEKVLRLAHLPYLQRVEVPLLMFAHMGPSGFDGTTAVPREVLPRQLRYLALLAHHECPYRDRTACWDSMERALEFLESLGRDLSNFEQLRIVRYCYCENSCANPMRVAAGESGEDQPPVESPPAESPEDSPQATTRSRLQAIHASFAEQNVEFSVVETLFGGKRGIINLREWKYYEKW